MVVLQFDRVDKVVRVPIPDTAVSLQELYDQSQDWLQEVHQQNQVVFLKAAGKTLFDPATGDLTEIVLTMIFDWRVEFEARAGPTTELMQVTGGTITALNSFGNNPIAPSAFTHVQFRAAHSGVILNLGNVVKMLIQGFGVDPATGKAQVFDDDGISVLLETDAWEDFARTIKYRGQGVERRDKFVPPP